MAEFDFHAVAASYFDNVLLAFICRFLPRKNRPSAKTSTITRHARHVDRFSMQAN